METSYNENCKAQAITIQWICRMLADIEVYINFQGCFGMLFMVSQ